MLLHNMKDTYDEIHENTNYEIGYEQMTAIDMAIKALMHNRRNMNKTDAAEILQKYVFNDEECIAQDMKDYNEALKMAIESLSAEYEDYEHASLVDIKEPLKVAVVRCKDCKWRKINRKSGTLNCGHEYGMITAKDDNFCNYGERSE